MLMLLVSLVLPQFPLSSASFSSNPTPIFRCEILSQLNCYLHRSWAAVILVTLLKQLLLSGFAQPVPRLTLCSSLLLIARCISKAWVCDGDSDCEDNSDEENCESLVCKPPSHTCANNTSICLPPEKLCDGNNDCGDWSDEGKLCGECGVENRFTWMYF